MLRSPPQRPVSPANTTFSGISSYRSDSYRTRDASNGKSGAPMVPAIDSKVVAKIHFEELTTFLASHISQGSLISLVSLPYLPNLATENQGARSNAREKLTKLTMQQ